MRVNPYPINAYKSAVIDPEDRKRVKAGGEYLTDQYLDLHNAYKLLDLKEGAGPVTVDVFVDRGKTLTVKLEDPKGQPVTGAVASGVTAMQMGAISLPGRDCAGTGVRTRFR